MKKVAIAAAVAGAFATSATAAELSTFIYQDYALNFNSKDVANSASIDTTNLAGAGSNMLNFNYSDDLGNGLGLIGSFSMIAPGQNARSGSASAVTNRNSFIGLTGDFGTVTAGTHELSNELEIILRDGWDANFGFVGGSSYKTTFVGRTGYTVSQVYGQSINWTSNDMNGLKLNVAYIMGGDTATASTDYTGTEANIFYTTGALNVSAGTWDHSDISPTSTTTGVQGNYFQGNRVSATYDFGAFSVAGSIWTMESNAAGTRSDQDANHLNLTMPMASGRFIANFTSADDQVVDGAVATDSGYSGWDVGYIHDASANTKLYVRYGANKQDANYATSTGGAETELTDLLLGVRFVY
jgi:predicted porin